MTQTKRKLSAIGGIVIFLAFILPSQFNHSNAAVSAPTRTLYLLGDSWTHQPANDFGTFDTILAERNLSGTVKVEDHSISGSSAAEWAADDSMRLTNLTTALVSDTLSNPVVYFTLGGNDLLAAFAGGPNNGAYAPIAANVRSVVTQIRSARDDVTIVIGGYDLTNPAAPSGNPFFSCSQILSQVFMSTDPADVNPYIIQLFTSLEGVANEFSNVYAVNSYGSLQGNPSNPDLSQWSPDQYIADCIHPNGAGYKIYLDAIFDLQLEALLKASNTPLDKQIFLPVIVR